jgi:hypothetical protein
MQSHVFDESLRTLVRRTPFRPFTVELMGGARFQVSHPETLAFNGGTAVFISPQGAPNLFDHQNVSQFVAAADSSQSSESA